LANDTKTRQVTVPTNLENPPGRSQGAVHPRPVDLVLGEGERGADEPLSASPPHLHLIYQLISGTTLTYRRLANGGAISFLKRQGELTFVPAGPLPEVWLSQRAKFLSIALDGAFVSSIIGEMDSNRSEIPEFRCGFRNPSIQAILSLLKEEAKAGSPSGALYTDSLAHALAIRFVLAKGGDGGHPKRKKFDSSVFGPPSSAGSHRGQPRRITDTCRPGEGKWL
jgi:hypothetical protein